MREAKQNKPREDAESRQRLEKAQKEKDTQAREHAEERKRLSREIDALKSSHSASMDRVGRASGGVWGLSSTQTPTQFPPSLFGLTISESGPFYLTFLVINPFIFVQISAIVLLFYFW